MTACRRQAPTLVIALALAASQPAIGRADAETIPLVLRAGRPLRVKLDERIRLKRVGQPITATVVEPVYAYDRIVVPAGAKLLGRVEKLDGPSKVARVRAMMAGDFSPLRHVVLQFETLIGTDGSPLSIRTVVGPGIANVRRHVAKAPDVSEPTGVVGRVGQTAKEKVNEAVLDVKDRAHDAVATIMQPGKMERLQEMAINRLPYHPQYLRKGTTYDAGLLTPLTFGSTSPADLAPEGTGPAPESILNASLTTALDSAKTPRGTALEAVLTQPVFSAGHQLILPEGTTITGEVTAAKPARRFHRNGQLRFLFERVQPPDHAPLPLLASLHAVDVSQDDHVTVDEEGGAAVTNSNTRFIAPALALLALRGSVGRDRPADNDADDVGRTGPIRQNDVGAQGVGGFLGFGLLGVGLAQLSHPLGVALAAVGVARTVYTNILGKGREVSFPADTPIQIQLAPGPAGNQP